MIYNIFQLFSNSASYDADAQAYFTATGITDATLKNAINNLIISGKTHGWYQTKYEFHFLAAGNYTKSKYNIISPIDADANYRLSTVGTVTYNSLGATGDGTTGYINTHLIPNTSGMTTTSGYMSIYISTNTNSGAMDMGSSNNTSDAGGTFIMARNGNTAYGQYGNGSYANSIASASTIGYWAVNRDAGVTYLYKNGSSIKNTTETATMSIAEVMIGTLNENGTIGLFGYSNNTYIVTTMGSKLTPTQASDEYTDIQTFLTAVGL